VEDPLQENDFDGFAELTEKAGDRCIICGDDLFVTNVRRLEQGIEKFAANAILIKPNQIGTVTDTYNAITLAKRFGFKTVMSHRSGETTDNTIAHLAVAFGCELLKDRRRGRRAYREAERADEDRRGHRQRPYDGRPTLRSTLDI